MFVKEISTELAVVPMISRMAEASKRWRDLSEEQRKEWKGRCQQMHDLYLEQLREYVQGLPEEQKVQYQAILEKASKKMKKSAKVCSMKRAWWVFSGACLVGVQWSVLGVFDVGE